MDDRADLPGSVATAPAHPAMVDAAAQQRTMPIQLWIDPICPWCLIGITRMTRAAEQLGIVADVQLRAYRLHPDWPSDGMSWRDFQQCRSLSDGIFNQIAAVGRAEGLAFDFSRIARVPDTTSIHRLLSAAKATGHALSVYHAMADAYFFRQANLADADTLREAAIRGGMSADAVRAALDSPDTLHRLLADEREARAMGVGGVPFMRFGRLAVAGAQTIVAYTQLLQRHLPPC
jgi:predicted DsbA family dithiol-disulfide isomerase